MGVINRVKIIKPHASGWPFIAIIALLGFIIGTVFGISTSLGLGANQINAGLNYLAGFEVNLNNQLIIIFRIHTR